jgi:hypothetical protein
MSIAISRSASNTSVRARDSFAFAPVSAVAWAFFALLGLLVRIALFREHRSHGATAVLWGLGFALFLGAGARTLGLHEARAILLALVVWAATALFIYLRGAGLDDAPAAQPVVFLRRLRTRSIRSTRVAVPPEAMKTRDLHRARVALADGDLDKTLYFLREARRVAVAQRTLDELLAVRGLLSSLSASTTGRTREATERLARTVRDDLHDFPADALAAAGIHVEPEREFLEILRDGRKLLAPADGHRLAKTRELSFARVALAGGEFAKALSLLQEARRVAVAQRRLDELLEVHELVQSLSQQSSGRTRAASERLARQVEAGLRSLVDVSPPILGPWT